MVLIKDLIPSLCSEMNISEVPEENEEKISTLLFTEGVTLYIQDLSPGFYIWTTIVSCPTKNKEDLFMHLMEANLFGQGTGGSVISLDENEKFLTLSLALAYEVNYKEFKEAVEDFVNYVLYWRSEIEAILEKAKQNIL